MTSINAHTPSAPPEEAYAPGHAPPRRAPSRTGPPGRRDSRRPAPRRARPSTSAVGAAAQRGRESRPHRWFAQQLLLVLSGQRPAHALLRHIRSEAFEELTRIAPRAPLRPRGADRRAPEVAAVGAQQPRTGVVEAYARIATGGRRQALAFRLELCEDRRWRCAAFEVHDPDPRRRAAHHHAAGND